MQKLVVLFGKYPRQFWLMFWGMLISTVGSSMIWPFLMIYVSEKLALPLTLTASLMTINSVAGLVFAFVAGSITDKVGRKWVMIISLLGNGLAYLVMSKAGTLWQFAIIMALQGAFNPLYRVGSDAMLADLIPSEQRADAYSLLRMSNNLGVAVGPAIGGFIASSSYTIAFYSAAAGLITYSILLLLRAKETLQPQDKPDIEKPKERLGGYDIVIKDKPFMLFNLAFTLTTICAAVVWTLLSVYSKNNFNIPEKLYGFIPATNAIMVVVFQYLVTQRTKKYKTMPVIAVGALFYAIGAGSIAFGTGFWGFWLSMVILTIGELIVAPTASTFVANLAPANMRGRYMSIYGLTWGVATGIGPLMGGILSDTISPVATWYGAGVSGLISVFFFIWMYRKYPRLGEPVSKTNFAINGSASDPAS